MSKFIHNEEKDIGLCLNSASTNTPDWWNSLETFHFKRKIHIRLFHYSRESYMNTSKQNSTSIHTTQWLYPILQHRETMFSSKNLLWHFTDENIFQSWIFTTPKAHPIIQSNDLWRVKAAVLIEVSEKVVDDNWFIHSQELTLHITHIVGGLWTPKNDLTNKHASKHPHMTSLQSDNYKRNKKKNDVWAIQAFVQSSQLFHATKTSYTLTNILNWEE